MSEYMPPAGPPLTRPPAPEVPEGWVAVWDDNYKMYFFVNSHTKQSQWDKPTAPAQPASNLSGHVPPDGPPPPAYESHPSRNNSRNEGNISTDRKDEKRPSGDVKHDTSGDEDYARRLQAEEDARQRGSASDYYAGGQQQQEYQQQYQGNPSGDRGSGSRGLFSSLFGKGKHSKPGSSGYPPQQYQQYPQQGYPPQQYGGYPQQQYGPQGYGPQGYGPPVKPKKSGMGMGTGLALGAGAGMLGGAFLAHEHHEEEDAYQDGYQDAVQDMGDGGGYGGDDFGGDFDF